MTAIVVSIPLEKLSEEVQETLRKRAIQEKRPIGDMALEWICETANSIIGGQTQTEGGGE